MDVFPRDSSFGSKLVILQKLPEEKKFWKLVQLKSTWYTRHTVWEESLRKMKSTGVETAKIQNFR